jgi:hypothetical protein
MIRWADFDPLVTESSMGVGSGRDVLALNDED